MQKTLAEIAKIIEGEVAGNKDLLITGVAGIKDAKEGDLTFLANPRYMSLAEATHASAILVSRETQISGKNIIYCDNPSLSFSRIIALFCEEKNYFSFKGIHDSAIIHETAVLGNGVSIGPCAVIEKGVVLGKNVVIGPGCFIGPDVKISDNSFLHANVTVQHSIQVGSNVTIHSGTIIGCDGYGYEMVDGKNIKIPQVGIVEIGNDVEIGSNVTVDRARFDKTIIGDGTKIDNLVQIAHNVILGKNCLIVSQVGISGSTVVEDNCILAGQAGIAGHLRIAKGSIVAAQAGLTRSLIEKETVWGTPARPLSHVKKVNAYLQRLPEHIARIKALEDKIKDLENRIKD